jgi:hypothetical protein
VRFKNTPMLGRTTTTLSSWDLLNTYLTAFVS